MIRQPGWDVEVVIGLVVLHSLATFGQVTS
jgi:hypothetical protein